MASQHIKHVRDHREIVKSPEDKRRYRGLELNNGLKILLVSDPLTDKSAASMDVNIGHMMDPRDIQGLAHFCEHMLFLGTEKYQEENAYSKFLNEHGGSSNAYTSSEHTNFFFDVAPEHLDGALDRFAQFFLCPLFTESASDREVNAVNSENDKNLQSDPWRLHQLEKSLADPQHDFSKFGTGNKDTLDTVPKSKGLNTRDELLKFHSKYYSSNIMGLCVLGKDSLDELCELVVPLFANVQNKNVTVPEWTSHPFGTEQLKTICFAIPVKDIRNLSLSWSIPDLHAYYQSNPGHYLGHLIGHEGSGSLLSELKARGWVNTLCGGQSGGANGFMFFKVDVDLTEEGLEHIDDIITLTYQYINMLKKDQPQEWVFKECQDLSAMTFRFKDKEKPRAYAQHLSSSLHEKYPMQEVLSGPYLLSEFRPDLINMILELLTPDNMRVAVVAKKFESKANETEKWYGTKYHLEKIPSEKIQKWSECGLHENLKLPARNEFITTNFDLVPREAEQTAVPEMIKDSAMSRLWFKQDDKYLLPKACISFELSSPLAYSDPVNCNMTSLFVSLFKDALNEYAYDAEIASLHYSLDCTIYGMSLSVRGYNEKQHVLLKKILEKLTSFKADPKRFEIWKEMYSRSLKNFNAEQPHQHAIYYTSVLMSEVYWTKEELLEALDDITVEKLQAFIPQLLSRLFIEGLIYGNVSKQNAIDISNMVEDILQEQSGSKPLLQSQRKRIREVQLPHGCYYVYENTNKVHKSSSVEIYYQCCMQETQSNMLLELFVQVIGEPAFNILRTKEQLGYIVFTGMRRASGVQGLRIIVQSDKTPQYVESRVEAFLVSMEKYLEEMTEDAFQKHVSALAAKRMEKPKKIFVQHQRYWGEIVSQQYNFERDEVEVSFLKTITKDDLKKFFKDVIAFGAPKRHKLSVHVLSSTQELLTQNTPTDTPTDMPTSIQQQESTNNHRNNETNDLLPPPTLPEPIVITNVSEFKRDMGLYPLPKPFIDIHKSKSKL